MLLIEIMLTFAALSLKVFKKIKYEIDTLLGYFPLHDEFLFGASCWNRSPITPIKP